MPVGDVEAASGVGDFAGVGHAFEEETDGGVGLVGGVGDFGEGERVEAGFQDNEGHLLGRHVRGSFLVVARAVSARDAEEM